MDPHLAHAAEYSHAQQLRRRVFLIRNLLCGGALLAGGIYGLMALREAQDLQEAAKKPATPNNEIAETVVLKAFPATGSAKDDGLVISGWRTKGKLLPGVASDIAGKPISVTRNPLDGLNFNREWDIGAEAVLSKTVGDKKGDPASTYVDTEEVIKASESNAGRYRTEKFVHVRAMADATSEVPQAAKEKWREAVALTESATATMTKARIAGSYAERRALYGSAKADLRKGLVILDGLFDSAGPNDWAYGVAKELLNSMISDCNKSTPGG